MTNPLLPVEPGELDRLSKLSTSVVASAIEVCNVRLPNTGFMRSGVRCFFDDLPPVAGYAATLRIRTAAPPMEGGKYSYARTDWWEHVLSVPAPRIMVIQDMDQNPGLGALVGEVNACILHTLGCVGVVTNGAIRDVAEVRKTGLQIFAGSVSVSHAYAHVFDFGGSVEVGGLKIRPGDLLHGDVNGVLNVPANLLSQVLSAADQVLQRRRHLTGLCRTSEFSIAKLREGIKAEM